MCFIIFYTYLHSLTCAFYLKDPIWDSCFMCFVWSFTLDCESTVVPRNARRRFVFLRVQPWTSCHFVLAFPATPFLRFQLPAISVCVTVSVCIVCVQLTERKLSLPPLQRFFYVSRNVSASVCRAAAGTCSERARRRCDNMFEVRAACSPKLQTPEGMVSSAAKVVVKPLWDVAGFPPAVLRDT